MSIKYKKDGVVQAFRSIADKDISAVSTLLSVDINGNLIVESFRKLIEYDSNKISLDTGCKLVYIYGQNMKILTFSKAQLQIDGEITKIEFFEV